jgi:hypothetical protein
MNSFQNTGWDTRAFGSPLWILLSGAAALIIGLSACSKTADTQALQAEARQLTTRMDSLSCALNRLEDSTRALWDAVNATLDENLPASMPPIERKNMLAVRNTQLIEMFMNYDSLDESVHRLVRKAGLKDEAIAQQVISTKRNLEAQELLFAAFLEKAAGMEAQELKKIEQNFELARKAANCGE